MVTSNKLPDQKVFIMSDDNNSAAAVPQRTLLGEVNAHLTCYLCRGYYIDATTIVECLHSFCRSCIVKHLQVKSYCPVCEMMINSAKPNFKPDKALQDIVYKLVPGLFQKEMERRRLFYSSRPGPAATATPEQRGEDTERIIFSPEDVISFSLEYADATDTDSISSKSSDSNEQQPLAVARRFLQCPAVVNISHLKKFLSMKFDIDSTQFSIDILYKRVPLPDYYTLMDIAYIYNWKRNKPMRFFYQIKDYIAIRNRYGLFNINRKGSHFHDKKTRALLADDTNADSPASNLQDHGSEASSGTDSPMPDDSNMKKCDNRFDQLSRDDSGVNSSNKNNDEEAQKSQFLNSFELTPKSTLSPEKSPAKSKPPTDNEMPKANDQSIRDASKSSPSKSYPCSTSKFDDSVPKRKQPTPPGSPEVKKLKTCAEKLNPILPPVNKPSVPIQIPIESLIQPKDLQPSLPSPKPTTPLNVPNTSNLTANLPKECTKSVTTPVKTELGEQMVTLKRPVPAAQSISSPKRKNAEFTPKPPEQRFVSPLKIQLPKPDSPHSTPIISKPSETQKPIIKKMPDLKLGVPSSSALNQNKTPGNKLRMDLLANNCDPTMDRSKILPHVKTLPPQSGQVSGDPLKSLFDSCKINIPSSLSITLTDQKLDPRTPEILGTDPMKPQMNKNNPSGAMNSMGTHKPTPPVHNYIEILKIPDVDPKKVQNKPEPNRQFKPLPNKKADVPLQAKPAGPNKSLDTPSAKGPVPSLKPIGETKLVKQSFYPTTSPFQQKYIQSLEEKSKISKTKLQVPKLMPASSKIFNAAPNKEPILSNSLPPKETTARGDNVLDLSTSHNLPSQLGPQQTKKLETMQSIANLAKKQILTNKGSPMNMQQGGQFPGMSNRPGPTEIAQMRMSHANQVRADKMKFLTSLSMPRQESPKPNLIRQLNMPTISSPMYQMNQGQGLGNTQPSQRQTRSPSSSPKLIIAEDKQAPNIESSVNQSNQISSSQASNVSKMEGMKSLPGPSKIAIKSIKSISTGIRQPILPTMKQINTDNILLPPQMYTQEMLRHMEWIKTQQARQQYEMIMKNYTNSQHNQKDNKQ